MSGEPAPLARYHWTGLSGALLTQIQLMATGAPELMTLKEPVIPRPMLAKNMKAPQRRRGRRPTNSDVQNDMTRALMYRQLCRAVSSPKARREEGGVKYALHDDGR
jgi:hypothetical protein